MAEVLPALIDKQDSFEIVRDQIAVILNENQAEQQVLAIAASKDEKLWALRVYIERILPYEAFLAAPTDFSPIVNVWYDSGSFDQGSGDVVSKQAHAATFNIDIYGHEEAKDVVAGGFTPGDEGAARTAQRGLRLCRNVLMAGQNVTLQLRPLVWQRWPQAITSFQPQLAADAVQRVVGIRLALRVTFNEFAPEITGEVIEEVRVDIHRASDGLLIAEADYIPPGV